MHLNIDQLLFLISKIKAFVYKLKDYIYQYEFKNDI